MVAGSSGGSAAAGGFRFETQVGAWLAVYALAEERLRPEFTKPWPKSAAWLTYVGLQTGYAVDDVAAHTAETGLLLVQAKKGLKLSASEESPLADALRQAVRMFKTRQPVVESEQRIVRDWSAVTDRIVIATDAGAPQTVRETW